MRISAGREKFQCGVRLAVAALAIVTALSGCEKSSDGEGRESLRVMTTDERAQDFDQLLQLFHSYYGPYQYKEALLGFKIDEMAAKLKAQAVKAQSDEEFAGYVMQFGASLHDGHVQFKIENTSSGVYRYNVPLFLTPVQGHILIGDINADLKTATGFSVGDEVLEVDGRAPHDYLATILKYRAFARDLSNEHLIAMVLSRPSYMTELAPQSPLVRIKVKTSAGGIIVQDVPWTYQLYNNDVAPAGRIASRLDLSVAFADELNSITGNLQQMGQVEPFFLTPATQSQFKFVRVYPDDVTRKSFGLADNEKPPIYAALYHYAGKNILLVREAAYSQKDFAPEVYLKTYMALLSQYQDLADVLVLDQTHNPGGSYCASFYNLFASDNDAQSVELLHADRKWINDLETVSAAADPKVVGTWDDKTSAAWGLIVEKAYDSGKNLSTPIPLFTGSYSSQKQSMRWTKPSLVLIDELAGSCGDLFPMLVKANRHIKLFGENTMGLGGNVEEVGTLNNSRIEIRLTRGMFFPYLGNQEPQVTDFVENHGVAPDYVYDHTVDDVRKGYVKYVDTFSAKAIEQIPAGL